MLNSLQLLIQPMWLAAVTVFSYLSRKETHIRPKYNVKPINDRISLNAFY